jgi:hypothetical protein
MVPSRWIVLDEVPLGTTGKADRKAMAAMVARPRTAPAIGTGADLVTSAVTEIVADELALGELPASANFVELGGNSIQAVRAAHRLSRRLNRRVQPVTLLTANSIEQLVAELSGP